MKKFSKKFLLTFLLGVSLFCFMGCKIQKTMLCLSCSEGCQNSQDLFVASLVEGEIEIFDCQRYSLKYLDRKLCWGSLVLPFFAKAKVEVDGHDVTSSFKHLKESKLPEVQKFLANMRGSDFFYINGNSLILENFFADLKAKGETVTVNVVFY